jgi:hypothetical protein
MASITNFLAESKAAARRHRSIEDPLIPKKRLR